MNRFFECNKTTAAELLRLGGTVLQGQPQTEIQEKLDHYVKVRKDLGIAGSTITKEVGAIIAFFRTNRLIIEAPKRLSLEPRYEQHRLLEKTDVKHMLDVVASEPQKQAVILTLAQTGQSLRVLTALSWTKSKRLALLQVSDRWGFVTIRPDMRNWLNESFNRANVNYTFLVHPESLEILRKIQVRHENRVFTIRPRHMQRIVEEAALKADIQEPIPRRLKGAKWHNVHAAVFQRYWEGRMRLAGIDSDLLKYLMGRKVTLAPSQVLRDHLLEVYEKARASLSLSS